MLDPGGGFKDYADFYIVQLLSTDMASVDANMLNYWWSKYVQEERNWDREGVRALYGIIWGIHGHLVQTVGLINWQCV